MNSQAFVSDLLVMFILVPTMIYALLPLRSFFRFSAKRTVAIALPVVGVIMVIMAVLGANVHFHFKWIFVFGVILVLALYMWLVNAETTTKFYSFFNSTMIAGNGIVYGMILAAPLEKDDSYIAIEPVTALVCIAVTIALGVIYYRTLSTKIAYLISTESVNLNYIFAIGVTLFISMLFIWVMPNYASVVMTGRVRITILAFLLLAPGAFLLVYHSMWRVAVNLTENAELRESNELMAMQQKRYEELRAYMNETRRLRHDFRQHLLVIDEYANRGEAKKLKEYIGQFTETLKDHRSEIAANQVLDAVASHYESLAQSQSTHIKWLIELPAKLPLKESDFITVFGNLVENALIAVSKLPEPERSIQVNARMLSDAMLGITVKNPYEGTITLGRDGLPKTSRSGRVGKGNDALRKSGNQGRGEKEGNDKTTDWNGHGIGLHSVKVVADRYNGAIEINTKGGIFSAGVLLYV